MFLRYLRAYGNAMFQQALGEKRTAECLPVLVSLSRIHRADLATSIEAYAATENLIVHSVLQDLDEKVQEGMSPEFKAGVYRMHQRLDVLSKQSATPISNLGKAIRETLGPYFGTSCYLSTSWLQCSLAPSFPIQRTDLWRG